MAKASKTSDKGAKQALWIPVLIAALVAFPAGFVLGGSVGSDDSSTTKTTSADSHDHDAAESSHSHDHEMFEVSDIGSAPAITAMTVTEDPKSGWNLTLVTDNFTFAPQNASGQHIDGEGHAHIYVDGEKLTRLYSHNYYLGELAEGEHTIRVTLNTNDHKDYAVDGEVVEASKTIVDAHHADDDGHAHDDHGDVHFEGDGHDH